MKFPTDAEIQFQSKKLGPLIPVRVRTVIRLSGSPTHIRIPTRILTAGRLMRHSGFSLEIQRP